MHCGRVNNFTTIDVDDAELPHNKHLVKLIETSCSTLCEKRINFHVNDYKLEHC